jgi:hypothetical protein
MIRSASLLFATGVAIALAWVPPRCAGQFNENQQYGRQVLVEGRRGLSDSAIDAVARLVAQRLTKEARGRELAVMWGGINLGADGAPLGEDASMGNLSIVVAGEKRLDDAQLQTLWDESRLAMQRSLRVVQQRTLNAQLAQLERQHIQLDKQRQQTHAKLDDAIHRLETLDGSNNSQEQIEQQLGAAVNLLRQIQLDRVGLDARRTAIDERTDYLRESAKAETEADPVISELRKIVDIREQQLARANQLADGAGTVTRAEVQQVAAELAQARIELLRAQRAASDNASGAILQELNNELSKLFVQDAELKARGRALEETVEELSAQASVAVRAEIAGLQQSVKSLRERLASIDDETAKLENKIQIDDGGGKITIRPLEEALDPDAEPADAGEAGSTGS